MNLTGEDGDNERNEEAYTELIQFLGDKGLSLIMREAADKGRKTINILREHYAGKEKPRDISFLVVVFTNGPGDPNSIPGRVIPKTEKCYLMPPCLTLGIIRYVSRVKE